MSARRGDDALRDRQAETGAALFRCHERNEEILEDLLRQARAGIGHVDLHPRSTISFNHSGTDLKLAFALHRLGGIEREVDQHLLEPLGIDPNLWRIRLEVHRRSNLIAELR